MSATGINPDGTERTRLDQLPRVAALASWLTPTDVTGCPSCGKPETTCRCDIEQIEAAETAENMDEDTAAPSETVLAAWPTPNTPNGGRSSPQMSATGVMPDGTKRQAGLEHVARLAGWATPRATDAKCGTEYTPN